MLLAAAGLYVLGAQPFAAGLVNAPWDKLAHVAVFSLVGGAAGLASGTRGWPLAFYGVAGALAIGVLDELHQAWLPGRFASWKDLLADGVGGLLGAVGLGIVYRVAERAEKRFTHR